MATIVLVGGSFLGAWAWERVTPLLRAAGHDVHPLTLTGFGDRAHLATRETGLNTHAADIVAALETARLRDVVLVAHSYSGAPATIAADRVPGRIARLVYLAAALPAPGRSIFEAAGPLYERLILESVAAGDGWRIPVMSDDIFDTYYGEHGLTAADRAWLRERAEPHPVRTQQEPAPAALDAVARLPRTYIVCTGDPGEPQLPDGVVREELDAGHWPMITAPAPLADLLDRIGKDS